ncbi:hypothetical protein F5X99DRAFT_374777 [Biscogniauxia marginata]|nr:hypothetical protein F5X99DRAFT_374777 [Biscogniauxia marginata]
MTSLPELPANFAAALKLIDDAHAEDPRTATTTTTTTTSSEDGSEGGGTAVAVPYELHYARQMTRWLARRCPDASPTLQLACRAQHFRRWETPRDTFAPTRAGYLAWRSRQKAQAAAQVSALLLQQLPSLPQSDVDRVAALVRKEGLQPSSAPAGVDPDPETQALEDVACLVFLDGELESFAARGGLGEDKLLGVLRKTWAKMSPEGRGLALEMRMSEGARELVGRALEG